jgi:hypothetical protein
MQNEVRRRRLEQWECGRRDRPPIEQLVRFFLWQSIPESETKLLLRQGHGLALVGRISEDRQS